MRTIIFLIVATLFTSCATTSSRESMEADVDQAVSIIERFEAIPESGIPPAVMRAARGLAILTVTKAAFIGGVRGGRGLSLRGPKRVGAVLQQSAQEDWGSAFRLALRLLSSL